MSENGGRARISGDDLYFTQQIKGNAPILQNNSRNVKNGTINHKFANFFQQFLIVCDIFPHHGSTQKAVKN